MRVYLQTLCEPAFPPHYNIVNRYIAMYHSNISQHVSISRHIRIPPGILPDFIVTIMLNIIVVIFQILWCMISL